MMKDLQQFAEKQNGAAAVEFALIATAFFMLLLGVVEIGRVLFTWNAAAEAARYGARVAVVCNMNDDAIRDRMRRIMPNLADANVDIKYMAFDKATKKMSEGCIPATCDFIKVSITNFQITTHIPVVSAVLTVPTFATTLPRESLDSTINPICS